MGTKPNKSTAAIQMKLAAAKFLDSLNNDQKALATFHYLDGERLFWYYPPLNRHGLSLRDMDSEQRAFAFDLMRTGLTERSYAQAKQIIDLENVLGPLEKEAGLVTFVRNPELYYFTIFGNPSDNGNPWGWRVEGHHISLHFSIWDKQVMSMTPFFFGSNPAEVRKGPKAGLRILGDREDMGFEIMESLDSNQQSKALIYDKAPWDILTYNSSKAILPKEEGLSMSRMNGSQKEIMMSLITEYVSQVRSDLAIQKLESLNENGMDNLHFAWAGPVEKSKAHYYRIHGGDFVVEFDNRQNEANHIHSVWRDVENDFGQDVLREHLLAYHVL